MLNTSEMTKTGKRVFLIFLINVIIGSIITSFMYRSHKESLLVLFLEVQIITQSISYSSFFFSRILKSFILSRFGIARYPIFFGIIFGGSLIGIFVGIFLVNKIFANDISFSDSGITSVVIPSLLITSIFIAISTVMERFKAQQGRLERDLVKITKDQERRADKYLTLKDDDFIRKIDYKDVIYLSSNRRSSVVHTSGQDYDVHQLLGDMEKTIPPHVFIRIHKQFIVNTRYISGMRYYEGGRYNLHLSDEDESVLPVGKAYTQSVKKHMKI